MRIAADLRRTAVLLTIIFAAVLLAGCGSRRTSVLANAETSQRFAAATIQEDAGGTGLIVEAEHTEAFRRRLEEALLGDKGFSRGQGLSVSYRFVEGDPGSRGSRFWIGFGLGEGTIAVEATFRDAAGRELRRTKHVGTVTGGGFGGSYANAFERAATELAEHARSHFLAR